MTQFGPRDIDSVLAARYVLTDKGEAAVAAIREQNQNEEQKDA